VSLPTLATSTPRARYNAPFQVAHKPRPATDTQKVTGHEATPSGLAEALKGAEIVVIPAGVPRKPGMTRDGTSKSVSFSIVTQIDIM
jgi:malate/lactate dehydrogenase